MPLPVTRHLPRVDRKHLVAHREQRLDPRSPVGLDADHHLLRPVIGPQLRGDQLMQPGDAHHPLGQPRPTKPPAGRILQLDVVMVFRPVVSHEQQPRPPVSLGRPAPACGKVTGGLMDQCSRPSGRARHPISGQSSPTAGRGTVLTKDSTTSRALECSPTGDYQTPSLPQNRPE